MPGWGRLEKKIGCARARPFFYFLFCIAFQGIFWPCSAYLPQKEKKKVARTNPGARGAPNVFFCFSTPRRGYVRYNCNYNYNYSIVVLCCKGIGECLKRTLGFAGLLKSGARARVLFFIFYFSFEDTLADTLIQKKKKKDAPARSGARADPNQAITARSP